jgi:hypothetical protein
MTIGGITLADLAPATLAGLAVLLVFLGYLVPRTTVKDIKEDRDTWKEAFETERSLREKADEQSEKMLEGNRATLSVLNAIFANTEQLIETGEKHDHSPPTS